MAASASVWAQAQPSAPVQSLPAPTPLLTRSDGRVVALPPTPPNELPLAQPSRPTRLLPQRQAQSEQQAEAKHPAQPDTQEGEGQRDLTLEDALEQGVATWYGGQRWHGRRTASGERFDRHALTAAHPNLPLGSWLRVRHLGNGREVLVRVNDRGPSRRIVQRGVVIDLSEAAAQQLGFWRQGRAQVALFWSAGPQAPDGSARLDPLAD